MIFDFSVNPDAKAKLFRIGPEQEPLIVVDGMMRTPQDLVECAARDPRYGPAGAAYPGLRCPVPEEYLKNVHAALGPTLEQVFDIPKDQKLAMSSAFAMVTKASDELAHNQRVPHVDRCGPHDLALVHYLCPAKFGGTAFFVHRQSGFQRLHGEREAIHAGMLHREMNTRVLEARFPGPDHPFYEQVAVAEAVFDRLIVYRSSILHSPAISPGTVFNDDPRNGRLTIASFLFPPI